MHCQSEGGWATYLRYRLTNSVNLEGITHTAHSALAGESGNESDSSPVPLLQLIPAVKPTSKTFPPAASDRLLPFVMLLLPSRIQCRSGRSYSSQGDNALCSTPWRPTTIVLSEEGFELPLKPLPPSDIRFDLPCHSGL